MYFGGAKSESSTSSSTSTSTSISTSATTSTVAEINTDTKRQLILLNNDERKNLVLTNIIKMLTNRGLLNPDNYEKNVSDIIKNNNDDNLYMIDLDYPEKYYSPDNKKMIIKMINAKVTSSMAKSPGVGEILINYKNNPKIFVVSGINIKIQASINTDTTTFINSEVFTESRLLCDIVSHVSQPKFYLLSEDESREIISAYKTKKINLPKMLTTDPVACYFNAKKGQIFRIVRPSETAGETFYYRHVVTGLIKDT